MKMGNVRVAAAIFSPFPIQNRTGNALVVDYVFDPLVTAFGGFADFLN